MHGPRSGGGRPTAMQAMPTLMMQDVYKQWLETAQQMYKLPAIPAQSKPEARTAGRALNKREGSAREG